MALSEFKNHFQGRSSVRDLAYYVTTCVVWVYFGFFIIAIAPARDRFHRRLVSHYAASTSTTHRKKPDYLRRADPVAVDKAQLNLKWSEKGWYKMWSGYIRWYPAEIELICSAKLSSFFTQSGSFFRIVFLILKHCYKVLFWTKQKLTF